MVAHVERKGEGGGAGLPQFACNLLTGLDVDFRDDDVSPSTCQGPGYFAPDAAACSGHEGGAAG